MTLPLLRGTGSSDMLPSPSSSSPSSCSSSSSSSSSSCSSSSSPSPAKRRRSSSCCWCRCCCCLLSCLSFIPFTSLRATESSSGSISAVLPLRRPRSPLAIAAILLPCYLVMHDWCRCSAVPTRIGVRARATASTSARSGNCQACTLCAVSKMPLLAVTSVLMPPLLRYTTLYFCTAIAIATPQTPARKERLYSWDVESSPGRRPGLLCSHRILPELSPAQLRPAAAAFSISYWCLPPAEQTVVRTCVSLIGTTPRLPLPCCC